MSYYGYHGQILFIDLSNGTQKIWKPSEEWFRIHGGGGLMGTAILLKHTPKKLDAFDPDTMMIFVSSVIAGNDAPGLARFSVVCKSPLSGGISESRCEGAFGVALKNSGFDAIVFTGKAQKPQGVLIEEQQCQFFDAEDWWGTDTIETCTQCGDRFGIGSENVTAIGRAGENLVRYADIVCGKGNHIARLGAGAVMGSKNLKYLAIRGDCAPIPADKNALEALALDFEKKMSANTLSMWQKEVPGFSAAADLSDPDTAYIGSENYKTDLSASSTEYVRKNYIQYYLGENHCPGCPGDCMKYIGINKEKKDDQCIHQEVTGALGPNLGIESLSAVLEANALCNRYGIDSVSLGATISFVMECQEKGIVNPADCGNMQIKFGDEKCLLALIEKIALRQDFGYYLGEGVKRLSDKLGEETSYYAMHVKGIEMVSFEPRTQTNLALGYAVAPYGPRYDVCEHDWDFDVVSGWEHSLDHARTLGINKRIEMQKFSPEKVKNFVALYTIWKACDTLNLCIFASAPTRVYSLEDISRLVSAVTGWCTSSYEFMNYGFRANTLMRLYNLREGLTNEDDILPSRFFCEAVQVGRLKGTQLSKHEFLEMRNLWYEICGWDDQGIPKQSTLVALSLSEYS